MKPFDLSLIFCLATTSLLFAEPTSQSPDPIAEALPVLQAKYTDFKDLNYKEGDHLSDLIARSNGRITLGKPEADAKPASIVTALLPGNIVYWRLASFTPEKSWDDLASWLKNVSGGYGGAVLDLRSNVAPDDYAGAAQAEYFFVPGDASFSKYLPSKPVSLSDRHFDGPIIVLVNGQTTGAAEALAACLKANGALLVGQPTAGKGAEFDEKKLSTGQVLRYLVGPVTLVDGTTLWGHPVKPDISSKIDEQTEKGVLILIRNHHVLEVIQEAPERHRMSEAALVKGEDPEWDAYLATLKQKDLPDAPAPTVHDAALIAALDGIKAIWVSRKAAAASGAAMPITGAGPANAATPTVPVPSTGSAASPSGPD